MPQALTWVHLKRATTNRISEEGAEFDSAPSKLPMFGFGFTIPLWRLQSMTLNT